MVGLAALGWYFELGGSSWVLAHSEAACCSLRQGSPSARNPSSSSQPSSEPLGGGPTASSLGAFLGCEEELVVAGGAELALGLVGIASKKANAAEEGVWISLPQGRDIQHTLLRPLTIGEMRR